jgi:CarD family transcriptional regulator
VFEVGETIVYPPHGAGRIEAKETKLILGEERCYLTIRILHSDMTLMVPADGAQEAGVRHVIADEGIEELVEVLTGEETESSGTFSRRFRQNREKIKTGDAFELAEVIRNLSLRDRTKALSTGERQMLAQAKRILSGELAYARGTDEHEALDWLDGVLADAGEHAEQAPGRPSRFRSGS